MKNIYILLFSLLPLVSCSQSPRQESITQKPGEAVKPADVFTTLQFEMDGKPSIAVISTRFKDFKNKTDFPLSVFLMVKTLEQDKNGHPTETESRAFHELQTKIIQEMSTAVAFCHIGTTTMTGYRDIIFYIASKDQEKATAVLNRIKDGNKRFQSYTFEMDPEWEAVESFYEAIPVKN